MGQSRYRIFENEYAYFVTCTVVGWLAIFNRPEAVKIVMDSWQFLADNDRMAVYGYVILENHLHMISSADSLAKELGDFKSFTARQIIDHLTRNNARHLLDQLKSQKAVHKADRDYQLWQEGSHPQQIRDQAMMRQKLEYMHLNPVKRGYVDDPTHWRYSSARDYAGLEGLFRVITDWG